MKPLFKKSILFALALMLAVASLPMVSVSAGGADGAPVPPGQRSKDRLERVWARQLRAYERIGKGFERSGAFVSRIQGWMDRARANGSDVAAVQAALDAFATALKEARPVYESGKGIVSSHQGFDNNSVLADAQKAGRTVKAMADKLKAIKDALGGTGRALRDAIRAFREANPRPRIMPMPSGG